MTVDTLTFPQRLDRAMSVLARRGTATRLHRRVTRAADVDVDRAAYLVLRRIASDGPSRITDVACRMGVEPSTTSRHVRALERRGWLEKQVDATDARVALAAVTAAGSAVVETVEAERHRILSRTLDGWDRDEVEVFIEQIERFVDDLTNEVAQ